MATRTDLLGAFDDIEERVSRWTCGELGEKRPPPTRPCKAIVHYTQPGASTPVILSEVSIAKGTLHAGNLRIRMESDVVAVIGANPSGHLSIQVWEDGSKSLRPCHIRRKLVPSDEAGEGSYDHMKQLFYREKNSNDQIVALLKDHAASAMGMAAETGKSLAEVATVKGTAQAANDFGGVWGIVGMVALAVGYPVAQRALKLPPGTSFGDTIEAARMQVTKAFEGAPGDLNPPNPAAPPPSAGGASSAPQLTGPDGSDGDNGGSGPPQTVEELMADPAAIARALAAKLADPEVMLRAKAMMKGLGIDLEAELLGVKQPVPAVPEPA